jgi:apolipoprotein D and lipocalin family protein
MTKFRRLIAAALLATAGTAAAEQLATVERVDLKRYAGTWHEQARLPMFFQRKCARNTTATYAIKADGGIAVRNRCETQDGKAIEALGTARTVPDSSAKLEVRFAPDALAFLPFVWADYWVIDLDPQYQWAVVGEPRLKYLWVLSRDKTLPRETLQAIVERAKAKGFATERLIYTPQL